MKSVSIYGNDEDAVNYINKRLEKIGLRNPDGKNMSK